MKLVFFGLLLSCTRLWAGDLSSELAKQSLVRISPVIHEGHGVYSVPSLDVPNQTAGKLCSILGYSRLVSYSGSEESISKGSAYWIILTGGIGIAAPSMELITAREETRRNYRLEEVVCAR